MLSIAPPPTIYLHSGTTDMRKSFDGLLGIICGTFGGDPADGSLFLFVNKRRDRRKRTRSCRPSSWCGGRASRSSLARKLRSVGWSRCLGPWAGSKATDTTRA